MYIYCCCLHHVKCSDTEAIHSTPRGSHLTSEFLSALCIEWIVMPCSVCAQQSVFSVCHYLHVSIIIACEGEGKGVGCGVLEKRRLPNLPPMKGWIYSDYNKTESITFPYIESGFISL